MKKEISQLQEISEKLDEIESSFPLEKRALIRQCKAAETEVDSIRQEVEELQRDARSIFEISPVLKRLDFLLRSDDWQGLTYDKVNELQDIRDRMDVPTQRAWARIELLTQKLFILDRWERHLQRLRLEAVERGISIPGEPKAGGQFSHSDDFRSIVFDGKKRLLTPRQAEAVRILYEAAKLGNPEVTERSVLTKLKSGTRLRDTFRSRPELWGTLIVSVSRGFFRLDIESPAAKRSRR